MQQSGTWVSVSSISMEWKKCVTLQELTLVSCMEMCVSCWVCPLGSLSSLLLLRAETEFLHCKACVWVAAVIRTWLFLLFLGRMVKLWCDGQLLSVPLTAGPAGGFMAVLELMLVKDLRGFEGISLTLYSAPYLWRRGVNNWSCIIEYSTVIINVAIKSHLCFGLIQVWFAGNTWGLFLWMCQPLGNDEVTWLWLSL